LKSVIFTTPLITQSFSLQGLGTDEDTLVEILASRTNKEIREIKQVYKQGNINANYKSALKFMAGVSNLAHLGPTSC